MINKVFGTGGIGTGIFFEMEGAHTLGRNESRLACLTDFKDYCKAHIILHYIAALTDSTTVYAIGKVGTDEQGETLLRDMRTIGIDTRYVEQTDRARTMFAVCFQYPDGDGGNITASNSACDLVSPDYIEKCAVQIDGHSLVLAAPEVPLESRIRLLQIAKEKKAVTVSSFLRAEAGTFERMGGFGLSDIISVNEEEAKAVYDGSAADIAERIQKINPGCKLIITAGANGVDCFDGIAGTTTHFPCLEAEVVSTAGAGDALLGGTIAAMIRGEEWERAVRYGMLIAKFAVESRHTIAENIQEKAAGIRK